MRLAVLSVVVLAAVAAAAVPAQAARWGKDYVPNVPVVTQDGKTLNFYDDLIKDKIVVLSFIYTSCKDICPLATARLSEAPRAWRSPQRRRARQRRKRGMAAGKCPGGSRPFRRCGQGHGSQLAGRAPGLGRPGSCRERHLQGRTLRDGICDGGPTGRLGDVHQALRRLSLNRRRSHGTEKQVPAAGQLANRVHRP